MTKDNDKIELLNLINEVFREFNDRDIYVRRRKTGVFSGLSGVALYQFYYAKYFNDEALSNEAIKNIFDCFNIIKDPCYSTYCDGVAGLGWVLDHLAEFGFIENENDDFLKVFDDSLFEIMKKDINVGYYDFLHGAIGYGFYFLNRYKRTFNPKLKKKYKSILESVLDSVNKSANKGPDGINWNYPIPPDFTESSVNLSLSHGISNMIIFLIKLGETEMFDDSLIRELLTGSIEYIISHKNIKDNAHSLYPPLIDENSLGKVNSRLAWCYGDLGIGFAFLRAGDFLGDSRYTENANEIFLNCCERKAPSITSVVDPMICHGSFGLSQIFQQLSCEMEISELANAANFWFDDGLKYFKKDSSYLTAEEISKLKGYKWQSNSSLLTGLSGVGLSIISNLTNDNSWNKSLLIS